MRNELPSWAAPVGITLAVLIVVGVIWAMMAGGPRKVDPADLGPIPPPAAPPPAG